MRILLMAEAVTLAHLARPLALAAGLQAAGGHTLVLARPASHAHFVDLPGVPQHDITSMPPERFIAALAAGRPVGDAALLLRQADEDLRLFAQVQPDLVVGDFRLSLSASARVAKLPYATISNLYWSPASRSGFPLPVLPFTRWMPLPLAGGLFEIGRRVTAAAHCAPVNAVRRHHGLPSLGTDLRRVYTDADHVLYTDLPDHFPTDPLPPGHHVLGPLVWSPPVPDPPWWGQVIGLERPVYLNLGSSGSGGAVLPQVLQALAALGVPVVAALAGQPVPAGLPPQVHLAPYLHGGRATAQASLVVCNGGSLTCQQALLAGRPVLGIASNMDQFMNMAPLVAAGAGICLRADRLSTEAVRSACAALRDDPAAAAAARRLGDALRAHDAAARFEALLPIVCRI